MRKYLKESDIMPIISCDAVKCVFNVHGGCSREVIEVEGNCHAHECSSTYCDSFSDKISSVKSCACTDGCPCSNADIECDVTSCMYNDSEYCTANKIHVGTSHAQTPGETECETFREKE